MSISHYLNFTPFSFIVSWTGFLEAPILFSSSFALSLALSLLRANNSPAPNTAQVRTNHSSVYLNYDPEFLKIQSRKGKKGIGEICSQDSWSIALDLLVHHRLLLCSSLIIIKLPAKLRLFVVAQLLPRLLSKSSISRIWVGLWLIINGSSLRFMRLWASQVFAIATFEEPVLHNQLSDDTRDLEDIFLA